MTCETLQGKYAEKLEREIKKMNKEIELLYKKLDAQDSIIDQQALEISELKTRLKSEEKVVQEYLAIEQRIDKAIEYIKKFDFNYLDETYEHNLREHLENILKLLGDKE